GRGGSPWADFDDVVAARRGEADEYYEELTPPPCSGAPAQRRGRGGARVLGRRGDRDAAGVRRDAVGEAALLLRREALARRRPHATAAPGVAPGGQELPLD